MNSPFVDGLEEAKVFAPSDLVVVLAERGGHVHDAGPRVERDEVRLDDHERPLPLFGFTNGSNCSSVRPTNSSPLLFESTSRSS